MIDKFPNALLIEFPYTEFEDLDSLPLEFSIMDNCHGFDQDLENVLFTRLNRYAIEKKRSYRIFYHQILSQNILDKYPGLDLRFKLFSYPLIWNKFEDYNMHPKIRYENFLCSFNGTHQLSRCLLTAAIRKFGWWNPETCSKNFTMNIDQLDGHLFHFLDSNQCQIIRKFFVDENDVAFMQTINSFGHDRFNHAKNIYNLQDKITSSFLHIVSETMATSYAPYLTEKFLYSVVTRGLFLTYGQPGWHDHLQNYYGFRKYSKIFDYNFDSIANPVERLLMLMCMISKFANLSTLDWHDLYEIESDTVEYNYDHYFSKRYLQQIQGWETIS